MMLFIPFLTIFIIVLAFSLAGRRFFQRWQRDEEAEEKARPQQEGRSPRWLFPRSLGGRSPPKAARTAPDPEARVFRLAYKRRGRITVSDAVIDLGLSIREAEDLLNGMVDDLRVRMEVAPNGLVVYEFPEILSRFRTR
jgi:hypothetical protein